MKDIHANKVIISISYKISVNHFVKGLMGSIEWNLSCIQKNLVVLWECKTIKITFKKEYCNILLTIC